MFYNVKSLTETFVIKNKLSSYSSMFVGASTDDNANLIVSYTNKNADVIDDYINTKSNNSHITKGGCVG